MFPARSILVLATWLILPAALLMGQPAEKKSLQGVHEDPLPDGATISTVDPGSTSAIGPCWKSAVFSQFDLFVEALDKLAVPGADAMRRRSRSGRARASASVTRASV